MKKLIVILGPNGVGKSTTAQKILKKRARCAYVDADWCRAINPFPFTPATKVAVTENIYCMLRNYLLCEDIDTTNKSPEEVADEVDAKISQLIL